jgi:hypothetical protein
LSDGDGADGADGVRGPTIIQWRPGPRLGPPTRLLYGSNRDLTQVTLLKAPLSNLHRTGFTAAILRDISQMSRRAPRDGKQFQLHRRSANWPPHAIPHEGDFFVGSREFS